MNSSTFQIGVEKKNDDLRRYFHRKINRWDAATNLLLVEKRQEVLREYEREKRVYVKRKTSFWVEGGKQESAKKVVRISTTPAMDEAVQSTRQAYTQEDLKKMKVSDLLDFLSKLTGKVFNRRTRKQDLIEAFMAAQERREN